MGKGFDQYAEEYDAWFLENPNVLLSEVRLVASTIKASDNVLSIGCGSGLFELILRNDFNINIEHGIEPSSSMASIAQKRGLDVIISTAEDYVFNKNEYNTILFNGSPSYITDLKGVVSKVYEALPEGGKIILIDVPKESGYGVLYNLAKALGTWQHPLLEGTYPPNPYPIELVKAANWRTTAEKIETLSNAGFKDLKYSQTLTTHPLYSNNEAEFPIEGYNKGDYVAIVAYK